MVGKDKTNHAKKIKFILSEILRFKTYYMYYVTDLLKLIMIHKENTKEINV